MTGLPAANSLPAAATTRLPPAYATWTVPNSAAQSLGDPKLRLMIFAPARAAATMPLAASAHVMSTGSPTDRTGAEGNIPTVPTPLNAPAAAEATIVPCGPSTGPGLSWRALAATSGWLTSTRSSTTAIAAVPGAGGASPGATM